MTPTLLPSTWLAPARTLTGTHAVRDLLSHAAVHGANGLLIHGRSLADSGALDDVAAGAPDDVTLVCHQHEGGEPTLDQLERLRRIARDADVHWVAAVGGGSVLDLAKACAGLLQAERPVVDYHNGTPIPPAATPFFCAPTTAGTGSEATMVSVLTNSATGLKKSIRHPSFMPCLVILDPNLLATCPPPVLAASGMDALTQAIESFISVHATDVTRALSMLATRALVEHLPPAFDGHPESFGPLLQASYLAGLALSHARLGIVHGLAHPLGARYHVPHGLACAACLPHALAFNREIAAVDYRLLSGALGDDIERIVADLWRHLQLCSPFSGQPLTDRDAIVAETLSSGSSAANPRPVNDHDVNALLDRIFA